ncbi:MAG: FAD-dependent monooxygenase [Alphaproteobacteria bacterium]|nr:FAD-dependent monooxygenase [Alphaproteobacteria bacterium]
MRRVVVVGAGIGGPALACLLRSVGVDVVLLEARPQVGDGEGAFLGVAPNGMKVLARLGLAEAVLDVGHPCHAFRFRNAGGRTLGGIDRADDRQRFGWPLTMVRRADLHRLLAEAAAGAGVDVRWGQAVVGVEDDGAVARVATPAGVIDGDVVVGCDGLRSQVRLAVCPEGPAPVDAGWLDAGGFADGTFGLEPGVNEMVFGARGFFGAFATHDGQTWWFSNGAAPDGPTPHGERLRTHLADLHDRDGAWVRDLIAASPVLVGAWRRAELPRLPRWTSGRLALLGDAAHAMDPAAGQGASMALEDAVALARCLRDVDDPAQALRRYEFLRRPRVTEVQAVADRQRSGKIVPGPVTAFFRDLVLPFALRFGGAAQDKGYAWDEPWEERVA